MEVPSVTSKILISSFSQRLVEGEFFQLLIRKPLRDFDHLLGRATEYINVEESQTARKKEVILEPVAVLERQAASRPRGPERAPCSNTQSPELTRFNMWRPSGRRSLSLDRGLCSSVPIIGHQHTTPETPINSNRSHTD